MIEKFDEMVSQSPLDRQAVQSRACGSEFCIRTFVAQSHDGIVFDQPARQSQTLTGRSQNNDACAFPILHLLHQSQTDSNHRSEQTD